ncbi:hypothetical protein [Streptomyces sp. NPDC087300]|uniref:hypothetical protein n=1 Tax=Streptomyces sp. NPDC087300 TaxID=3365780 RepID=UPI0037FE6153
MAASVLANLRHGGVSTASELAAIEGLQTQSLTRVLNELEEQDEVAAADVTAGGGPEGAATQAPGAASAL